jgi:hypothetical protein
MEGPVATALCSRSAAAPYSVVSRRRVRSLMNRFSERNSSGSFLGKLFSSTYFCQRNRCGYAAMRLLMPKPGMLARITSVELVSGLGSKIFM